MKYSNRGHFAPFHSPAPDASAKSSNKVSQKHKNQRKDDTNDDVSSFASYPMDAKYVTIQSRKNRIPSPCRSHRDTAPPPVTRAVKETLAGVAGTSVTHNITVSSHVDLQWHLKYEGSADANGITYLLGTQFYRTPYQNPSLIPGMLSVLQSSTEKPPSLLHSVVLPTVLFERGDECSDIRQRFQTKWNEQISWLQIDFGGRRTMKVNRYCLQGTGMGGNDCPVDWELQGRVETGSWRTLRAHVGDGSLVEASRSANKHQWVTWLIESVEAKRLVVDSVRLILTNVNASGNARLTMCGLELYGLLSDPDMPCRNG